MNNQLALAGFAVQVLHGKLMPCRHFCGGTLQIFGNRRAPAKENTHRFSLWIPAVGLGQRVHENLVPVGPPGMEILVVFVLALSGGFEHVAQPANLRSQQAGDLPMER